MKQKRLESWAYVKPKITVCGTQTECLLTSFSGNAGTITPGAGGGDAKSGWFDEEEDVSQGKENLMEYNPWEN